MNQALQKAVGKYLVAKRAWGAKWVELYENDAYKNATVTDRMIKDTNEDDNFFIAKLELDLLLDKKETAD